MSKSVREKGFCPVQPGVSGSAGCVWGQNGLSPFSHKMSKIALVMIAVLVALPAVGQRRKKATPDDNNPANKRTKVDIDISKIVWPSPPAIARVKFMEIKTGQKIDPDLFKAKKGKQSWMDRLAGAQPVGTIDEKKIPYQLLRPYGVAVDSKRTIYAADQGVGAIFMFDDEGNVSLIKNKTDAHFGLIDGLAIDDDDRLFVSDSKLNRVMVFSREHKVIANVGADVLLNPAGVAIDTENRFLYVADTGNDVIRVFDADSFKPLRVIGVPGKKHSLTDPGTFSLPYGVAVDGAGNLYVTDTFNDRVEIFDADGTYISQFGKNGDAASDFERPKGIAIDCDGHIWVADAVQMRVKVFDREGKLLIYFGGPGYYPGQFNGPSGIVIDKENRVIVTETFPGRIQVFQYVTDAQADKLKKARQAGE